MNIKTSFILFTISILSGSLFFSSCNKSKKYKTIDQTDIIEIQVDSVNSKDNIEKDSSSIWKNENNEVICVVFGYGFNKKEFYEPVINNLEKNFGLKQNGGYIWPVIYPDDLHSRIMNLYDQLIEQENLKGILVIGAPERTHYVFAKLQDYWKQDLPFPIAALFPQDDILGIESTCNFVLEYERNSQEETQNTEIEQVIDNDIENLIIRTTQYLIEMPYAPPLNDDLLSHVQFIAGNKKVKNYIDSESGIQSQNHFIMECQ